MKTEFGDMVIVRHQKMINIDVKPYEVGVDIGEGKDYTGAVIIGAMDCVGTLAEIAKERGIKVVCLGHIDEETKVTTPMPAGVKQIKIGAVGFTMDHILEFNRQFKELPVPKSIDIDESTPNRIDYMELRGPYCPRKNDNKPWYSRFDKKKKR